MMISSMEDSTTHRNRYLKQLSTGTLIAVVALLITTVASVLTIGVYLNNKYVAFQSASGLSKQQLLELTEESLVTRQQPLTQPLTILILGLDTLETRPGSPKLTDTMLLAQIDFETATITTLPLPRDLWSPEYQTRINALYHYGTEQEREQPETFPAEVLADMTGLTFDYTIVIEMDRLSELIDLVGGVTVDIPEAFTDDQFPRSDVDVTKEADPAKLYKTVSFAAGEQLLTGESALEYIRSRKSAGTEGTDLARSRRQQQVILALFEKITNPAILLNPTTAGSLVSFYLHHFDSYMPLSMVGKIGVSLLPKLDAIAFQNEQLPVSPESEHGVIYHPPTWQHAGQWIYLAEDHQTFKAYFQTIFNSDHAQN